MRRMPGPSRFVVSVTLFAIFAGSLYLLMEFGMNKGPDDIGAMWHAGYPVAAKYGMASANSYSVEDFQKDTDDSGSGTYKIRFKYGDHRGMILCHYDKAARKFDHDDIEENE